MNALSEDSCFRRDDQVVMMSLEKGAYYGLNEVAAFIWELLEKSSNIATLVEKVTEEFDVNHERCLADILIHRQRMETQGVVT